jgi:replication factor A1
MDGADIIIYYRIIISDGSYFTQAMLATQQNDMIEKNQVSKNSVVKLKKFHASKLSDQR